MATDTLQNESAQATPTLADELRELHSRAKRMEKALQGACAVIRTVHESCVFDHLQPGEEEEYQTAYSLMDMMGDHLREVIGRESERDWVSDSMDTLRKAAELGELSGNGDWLKRLNK